MKQTTEPYKPPITGVLYGLDNLRAFAITIVFLYHYAVIFSHPEWLVSVSKFGWTGVDLFFVLSGYLISSQLFKEIAKRKSISFRAFFIKRFFRIIPAYLFVTAIYFCIPAARERNSLAPLWKYLTFTQNLGLDLRVNGTFSHAWSLCIEEQFYLILPLVLYILLSIKAFRKGWWLLIIVFVFGIAARLYAYDNFVVPYLEDDNAWVKWYRVIYYPTYSRLDGLLTGVAIATLSQFLTLFTEKLLRFGNLLFFAGICVLSGAYFLCLDEKSFAASVFGFPLISIGYGLLVMAAISPKGFMYKYKFRPVAFIARLSFGIYLTHKIIIHITQAEFKKINVAEDGNLMFLICITTTVLAAFLINRLIESPFLKLRNKLLKTSPLPVRPL